jgi:endonuclease YncB( thermonuclease family)
VKKTLSISFLKRLVSPLFWMVLGGAFVFYWNPRAPSRSAVPLPSIRTLPLTPNVYGLECPQPKSLPLVPVLRVVDGDTLEILWDDQPTFLRYYGVNTTERGQACSQEATARNKVLVGGAVRLAFDDRSRDAYGRLLAYVFTAEGQSVDAQLVAEGLGKAWKRDGLLKDHIGALETEARESQAGCLWSGKNPSPKPKSPRKRRART